MMMRPERKKALTVIMAGMGSPEPSSDGDDYGYALKACARKIMQCMEDGDSEGFCEYMADFIEMYKDKQGNPREMDY